VAKSKHWTAKGRFIPIAGAIAVDEEGDLALLSVDMPAAPARSSELATELPDEGEGIFVIGNPLKLEGSVSDGIVSAVREVPNSYRIIQITAPISHGNSGSPVFNLRGQVLGVVTVKVTNGQNINLAIAAARVGLLRAGALRPLSEVTQKPKGDVAEAAYRSGLESLWLGNYDNAVGYFENAVNKNPRRADAWVKVGYCKVKQGKIRKPSGRIRRRCNSSLRTPISTTSSATPTTTPDVCGKRLSRTPKRRRCVPIVPRSSTTSRSLTSRAAI
jgi:hypothetical protein